MKEPENRTNSYHKMKNKQIHMKKQITLFSILLVLICSAADAQSYGGSMYMQRGYRRPPPPRQRQQYQQQHRRKTQSFKPTVNLSFGYGYPNLDKNYFPDE